MAEQFKLHQEQLSNHTLSLDKLQPKAVDLENLLDKHDMQIREIHDQDNTFSNQIKELFEIKVNVKDEIEYRKDIAL